MSHSALSHSGVPRGGHPSPSPNPIAPTPTPTLTLTVTLTLTLTPTQACRAVGGLLAYLQRTDVSSSMSISKLERCRIDPC